MNKKTEEGLGIKPEYKQKVAELLSKELMRMVNKAVAIWIMKNNDSSETEAAKMLNLMLTGGEYPDTEWGYMQYLNKLIKWLRTENEDL